MAKVQMRRRESRGSGGKETLSRITDRIINPIEAFKQARAIQAARKKWAQSEIAVHSFVLEGPDALNLSDISESAGSLRQIPAVMAIIPKGEKLELNATITAFSNPNISPDMPQLCLPFVVE